MKKINIELIAQATAKEVCQNITKTLPEWFGIPEANENYANGMLTRLSFVASIHNEHVGMITLEFPYPNNANIYWMGVAKNYHRQAIGKKLLIAAENYCLEQGYSSLTVETLSEKQQDENYLNTYYFYERSGFKPLFEMHTYDPHNLMVYMQKTISLADFLFIDLSHVLSSDIPAWNENCGFRKTIEMDYADSDHAVQFCVQRFQMAAGIGTHLDAPKHCFPNGASISDIPLSSLICPCNVINVSSKADAHYSVSVHDIHLFENKYGRITKGAVVIIYTGWEKRWGEPEQYRNQLQFPSVSKEAAQLLLTRGIAGLGIDTLSPDIASSGYPVHQLILGEGKFIIENIAHAQQLNPTGDFVLALPIKIKEGTEAPMRLVGMKRKIIC